MRAEPRTCRTILIDRLSPKLTLIAAILLVTVKSVAHVEQLCAFFYRIRLARPSIPS